MIGKYLLLCFALLHSLSSFGQSYPYKQFTTRNGLINNRCGNVSQDSAGYIWITSDNGISNYDGRKFNFFPGKNSTYYFAHTNTINMYKGQCLFSTNGQGFAVGLANNLTFNYPPGTKPGHFTYGLILDDSTTLVARYYSTSLDLIEGSTKITLLPPATIAKYMTGFLMFLQDAEKNIWIGTDAGIYIYKRGNFNDPYVLPVVLSNYCNVLKTDFEGNVLIASHKNVYKIYRDQLKDVSKATPVHFATQENEITALGINRNGDILVSDYPYGIAIYNKTLQLKKKITKYGLPDVVLWDIFVDREENIWLATENGVYRFSNFNVVNYSPGNVKGSPNIRHGFVYENSFIFSNGIDIFSIENESIKKYNFTHPINNYVFSLQAIHKNTMWMNLHFSNGVYDNIITEKLVLKKDKINFAKTINNSSISKMTFAIDKIVELNYSSIAFLTDKGILMQNSHDVSKKIMLPPSLDSLKFNTIADGLVENNFFIAANGKGLFHCSTEQRENGVLLKIIDAINFDEKLQNDQCIKIVAKNKNEIWLATKNNGIRIFKKENNSFRLYKLLTEPEISSSLITALQKDSEGNMWIGSNKGVDKVSFTNQNIFNINKGLFNNAMSGQYIYFIKEHNNKLYIGNTGSLFVSEINPKLSSTIPTVRISHLLVNNANADSLLGMDTHVFSPSQNNLTFEFVSPTFIDEQATEYQYQLQGVDKEWSKSSSNYIIAYSQLPAGDYTFKVRAKNANSVWSLTDAVFSFTIKKPFYKHWLFFLLCSVVITGVFYWLYKQKMNRIIAVERTRRSISKDLHDDIGTTLSSITLMNAVLKNKIESQPEEAKKMAAKIENTSRDMIQNMSDIVWSINPNNDTMEKLIYRLQQFCNDVFDKPGVQYKFNIDEEIKSKVLNMQLRRDIFLICKEIINNAAKYSKATHFNLSLSLKQKTIILAANDNGIGFDENIVSKGNGLMNIRQRVNTYNGEVNLTSDSGTTWHITIPT